MNSEISFSNSLPRRHGGVGGQEFVELTPGRKPADFRMPSSLDELAQNRPTISAKHLKSPGENNDNFFDALVATEARLEAQQAPIDSMQGWIDRCIDFV